MTAVALPGVTVTIPGPTFETVAVGSVATGVLVGGALTRSSTHNCIFVVVGNEVHPAVQLPEGCEIGDLFEIYVGSFGGTMWVFGPSGETFGDPNPLNPPQIAIGAANAVGGKLFRKLTSTLWGTI